MAVFVIGDLQGCFAELQQLLSLVNFDATRDELWFTGDLVNRGTESLATLRFVRGLGDRAVTVLGNHDLHMLAVAAGTEKLRRHDTFQDVLNAPDREELLTWLQHRPLLHHDAQRKVTLVHAGLVPQWDLAQARRCAAEVEVWLRGDQFEDFFRHMYGNEPRKWNDSLAGFARLRFITNTFTRIRYCNEAGEQILDEKGPLGSQPAGFVPWFEVPGRRTARDVIVFGHWAALGAGAHGDVAYSVDSGCAWGGALSALRIDVRPCVFTSVSCVAKAPIT